MIQTLDGLPIRAGDIVLIEYVDNYTAAVVVGFEKGRYYRMPKEYQWSQLASKYIELERVLYINDDKVKFLTVLGVFRLDLIPGYMDWLHGDADRRAKSMLSTGSVKGR